MNDPDRERQARESQAILDELGEGEEAFKKLWNVEGLMKYWGVDRGYAEDFLALYEGVFDERGNLLHPPDPLDTAWWLAVSLADEDGEVHQLITTIFEEEVTPYARKLLADLVDRRVSKRRDKPKKPIYRRYYPQLEAAKEFAKLRRKRYLAAAKEAEAWRSPPGRSKATEGACRECRR